MFLKRTLTLVIGVLLFIGAFLLFFKMRDTTIEKTFRQTREDYGVQGSVLTAAQPSFAVAEQQQQPAPTPPSAPVAPADDSATPPPGAAPDTNTIIGPVPPSPDTTPAPESSTLPSVPMTTGETNTGAVAPGGDNAMPAPPTDNTAPSPAPASDTNMAPSPSPSPASDTNAAPAPAAPSTDTNSAPMAPSSTMLSPRLGRWTALLLGAMDTNAMAAPAPALEPVPAPPSAPVAAETETVPTAPISAIKPASLPPRASSVSGRAIVLGYHQFTGPGIPSKNIYSMSQDVFAGEMKYLHDNGYNVVPLSQVVAFVEHKGTLPPNAVAITIDDGYKSALNYAAPVLKQYGYPWTYFVYPAFITRTESKGAASWPDLLELGKEGVDVESHSMTHPQLSRHRQMFSEVNGVISYGRSYHDLTPAEYDDFLTNETAGAKAVLEHELGKKIKYLAYPYGDYNQAVEAKAIAAGYEAIFTVADNPVHVTTDVHSIGRYIITKPVEKAFAGYLRQGALSLAQVDPAPGATVSNPEPVITAVLGFNGDPKTIETDVRDYGMVKHDFDPATSTIRIYLPRPLIQPVVIVSIRARDVQSGQSMVANWHFNYEPAAGAPLPAHPPITGKSSTDAGESAPMASPAATTVTTLAPATPPKTNDAALSSKTSP
jgi:peptidoglycan/xylan/chitin deacetylase (PgdA/CDA1 family)